MKFLNMMPVCMIMTSVLLFTACTRHEVEVKPVEIKPIHITIDVNVRVERALEDFFGDLDELQAK